MNLIAVGS